MYVSHRFHYIMFSAKKVLSKLAEFCTNTSGDTAILMITIKLYLIALSGYSEISNEIIDGVTNAQIRVRSWLLRPETGMEDCFGGNSSKKLKEEIKVCFMYVFIMYSITTNHRSLQKKSIIYLTLPQSCY